MIGAPVYLARHFGHGGYPEKEISSLMNRREPLNQWISMISVGEDSLNILNIDFSLKPT